MNTKFKRALSSMLAFIMLFSCITVMNVSSVWADANSVVLNMANANNKVGDTKLSSSAPSEDISGAVTFTDYTVEDGYTLTAGGAKWMYKSYKDVTAGDNDGTLAGQSFTSGIVNNNGKATTLWTVGNLKAGTKVEFYFASCKSDGTVGDGTAIDINFASGSNTVPSSATKDKVRYVSIVAGGDNVTYTHAASGRSVLYAVVITPPAAGSKTYNYSGQCTLLPESSTFTLKSDDEAIKKITFTVGKDGMFTASANGLESPIAAGTAYEITPPAGYTTTDTVTFTAGTEANNTIPYTATADLITFTSVMKKVSGTVDTKLANVGDTLVFVAADKTKRSCTVTEGNAYSISLPEGTYTIDLQDGLYTQVPYYISNDTATINVTADATHAIKATAEISTWKFVEDAAKYANGATGVYESQGVNKFIKGLWADTLNGGKFVATTGQFRRNSTTKLYVPVKSENDIVTFGYKKGSKAELTFVETTSKADATGTDRLYKVYTNADTDNDTYVTSIAVEYVPTAKVSGTVTADGVDVPTKLYFTNTTTNTVYTVDVTGGTYTAELGGNATYKVSSDNLRATADSASAEITVTDVAKEANLKFVAAQLVKVSGTITSNTGATDFVTGIKFENITNSAESYTATVTGDTYSVEVAPGTNYKTVATVNNNMTTINKTAVGTESINDEEIYFVAPADTSAVEYKAEISVPSAEYPTITAALSAIKRMTDRGNKRVTVNLTAPIYKEQIKMDVDNVTFKSTAGATITNYYGYGYMYYSVASNGFYDEQCAKDKYEKNEPVKWAPTVYLTGNNFIAEGVTFKNSFNYEVTAEEVEDGVEPNPNSPNKKDMPARTSAAAAASKGLTERAAAITAENADKFELVDCKILSSQDTLMTHGGKGYIVNSYIEGNTDFICGDTPIIFDDCTLAWKGYSDSANAGYLTAAKNKYLFRNCTVQNSTLDGSMKFTTGTYGRNWAAGATVVFADINTTDTIVKGFTNKGVVEAAVSTACHDIIATTDANYTAKPHTEATAVNSFTSTMASDTTIDPAWVQREYYLGDAWVPENYAFAVDMADVPVEATWDFNPATTNYDKTEINGKVSGYVSDYAGVVAQLDATSGKLSFTASATWAQFNNGTKFYIPVYNVGDVVSVVSYANNNISMGTDQTVEGASNPYTFKYTAKEADVAEGFVTVLSVGGSDSYISSISLKMVKAPSFNNVFSYNSHMVVDNNLYVAGKVDAADLENADKVGFGAGLTAGSAIYSAGQQKFLDTDSVAEKVIAGTTEEVTVAEGQYVAAFELTGAQAGTIYVVPFTTVGTSTVYGNAVAVTVSTAA